MALAIHDRARGPPWRGIQTNFTTALLAIRLFLRIWWTWSLLFFVLSGFIFFWLYCEDIAAKKISFRRFFLHRIARLYPLHLLTLLAVAVLQYIHYARNGTYFESTYNDLYHFTLQLLFMSHWGFEKGFSFNVPIWSVSIECGLYLIFFATCYLKQTPLNRVISLIGIACGLELLGLLPHWMVPIEAFFMGGVVAIILPSIGKTTYLPPLIIALAMGLWICILCLPSVATILLARFHFGILLTFPLTVCALVLMEQRQLTIPKSMAILGDISFGIYLIHFPMQLLLQLLIQYFELPASIFYQPITLIIFLLCVLSMSVLSFRFFERPLQRMIRRRFSHRPRITPETAL